MVPLLIPEATTPSAQSAVQSDREMVVWWATRVECASAIARSERHADLTGEATIEALERLDALAAVWEEVEPVASIRLTARRLLRVHNLRAADALQLAAALIASEGHPASLEFVTLDDRLVDAAQREGFPVVKFADSRAC